MLVWCRRFRYADTVNDRPQAAPATPATVPAATAAKVASRYTGEYLGGNLDRIFSYRMQAVLTLRALEGELSPRTLLVGKGNGIVDFILDRCGVTITTLDMRAALEPDIVASVEEIPSEDGSFDCVLCCQVLEHLPFEKFRNCLAELKRVCAADGTLILSLPDQRPYFGFGVVLKRSRREFGFSMPCMPARRIPEWRLERMGHHWEVGFSETPFRCVKTEIAAAGWRIGRVERVRELPWHTFFVCKPEAA